MYEIGVLSNLFKCYIIHGYKFNLIQYGKKGNQWQYSLGHCHLEQPENTFESMESSK